MRSAYAETLNRSESRDLLTTGEAAQLLGSSRQHVVDLCARGDLPFLTVGTHRRIARHDVEVFRARTARMTTDQLRSLWLSHAVAAKVVLDPPRVLGQARENLQRAQANAARGSARIWLEEWWVLLSGPIDDVLEALTSRSPRARELRQNSPFAGVLSETERKRVLESFASARHQGLVT